MIRIDTTRALRQLHRRMDQLEPDPRQQVETVRQELEEVVARARRAWPRDTGSTARSLAIRVVEIGRDHYAVAVTSTEPSIWYQRPAGGGRRYLDTLLLIPMAERARELGIKLAQQLGG